MAEPKQRKIRLNFRAVVALVCGAALLAAVALGLSIAQKGRLRRSALAEAAALEKKGDLAGALRHLTYLLTRSPGDIEALERHAALLTLTARDGGQILAAAAAQDQLLRLNPDGPGRQANRRALVELYVRHADGSRASALSSTAPEFVLAESRYNAAVVIGRDLISRQPVTPADHRALASALEGMAVDNDPKTLAEAVDQYEVAHKGDPGDLRTAERLSRLLALRLKDPGRGDRVIAETQAAQGDSVEALVVAYRYYRLTGRPERAAVALDSALKKSPEGPNIRLMAAADALERGDIVAARGYIGALPEEIRGLPEVQFFAGRVDLTDQQGDRAVEQWRRSLLTTRGTREDVTFDLANLLLQLNRPDEARPLIGQYLRLQGVEGRPMGLFLKGVLDEKSGEHGRALGSLRKAKGKIPGFLQVDLLCALARCRLATGDRDGALGEYRDAIQADPLDAKPRIGLVELLAPADPLEAVRELERAVASIPGSVDLRVRWARSKLVAQGRQPRDRRDWSEFERALALVEQVAPGSAAVARLKAERSGLEGDIEAGLRSMAEATLARPRIVENWIEWVKLLVAGGRPEEALKTIDRAVAPGGAGDHAALRIARAAILVDMGRGRDAHEALARGLDALPADQRPEILRVLGELATARGDDDAARAAYATWARLRPDDPAPRLSLCALSLARQDVPAALAVLGPPAEGEARSTALARIQTLLRLPGAEATRGLNDAAKQVDALLAETPDDPGALLARAEVLDRLGSMDEATAAAKRAWQRGAGPALTKAVDLIVRRKQPAEVDGLARPGIVADFSRLAAEIAVRRGDTEMALAFARRVGNGPDATPEALAWRARMLSRLGQADAAEETLAAIADRQPDRVEPWQALIAFQAGRQHPDEARSTAQRAIGLIKSDRPELAAARLHAAADDRDAADASVLQALEKAPEDTMTCLVAAAYYRDTGRSSSAEASLRGVLKRDPTNREAARQLAVVLAGRGPAAWSAAWDALGPEAPAGVVEPAEDRKTRALLLARCPDPTRRATAIPRLESLLADLPPSSPAAPAARVELARLLVEGGQAPRAIAVAELAAKGNDPAAIALTAAAMLGAGQWDRAQATLDRLAEVAPADPAEPQLRARLTRLRTPAADAPSALEALAKTRDGTPGGPALAREVFAHLASLGKPALPAAERVAEAMKARDPGDSWALARLRDEAGKPEEALPLCRAAFDSSDPADVREAARVAADLARQGKGTPLADRAAALLEVARDKAPGDPGLTLTLAMIRGSQGRHAEAADLYRDLLKRNPENLAVLNNLAWTLCEGVNRPQEALPFIDDLIRRVGDDPHALDTRGVIHTRLSHPAAAVKDLEAAVRAEPSATRLFHLARAYRLDGRADAARDTAKRARDAGLTAEAVDPADRGEWALLQRL